MGQTTNFEEYNSRRANIEKKTIAENSSCGFGTFSLKNVIWIDMTGLLLHQQFKHGKYL